MINSLENKDPKSDLYGCSIDNPELKQTTEPPVVAF